MPSDSEPAQVTPDSLLEEVACLGKRAVVSLHKAEFVTVRDLLVHYPRRYEDRRRFDNFPTDECEKAVCLHGVVADCRQKFLGKGRRMFEATLEEADPSPLSGPIICRWFNLPYISKVLAVDQELIVYGRPKRSGQRLVVDHPEFEIVDPGEVGATVASVHLGRITPVYGLQSGLSQRVLRASLFEVLAHLDLRSVRNVLPEIPEEFDGVSRFSELQRIHFPDSFEELEAARRFLALEEFFHLQLNVAARRQERVLQRGAPHCGEGLLLKEFLQSLPFRPTGAQARSIDEIRADLARDLPMNRLLQGDVGTGKTLVALAAMLLCVEGGFQAALMAPTQILAEQHYLVISRWLEHLDVRVSLRTGSRAEDTFLELGGAAQIIIGTHALIHDKVEFEKLGLVVVDEQHKFGVAQRARLSSRGEMPDVLVMTATPIPRTLTMSVYGDLDVSVLDELPAGRGKIVTGVREISKTPQAAEFVRGQLEQGRQAYIVYPLIEDSEKLKLKSATAEYEEWSKRFEHFECALIHGKIPAEEKESIMERFRNGEVDVLVSTTVIEVGVDVPNANIMLIYNAERFGLAQLHQLRGRIGRGSHKSYCVLMCNPKTEGAMDKLSVLEDTADGFKIAEADLRLRGPGDLLGTMQSGLPALALGDLLGDQELVHQAKRLAARVFEQDPRLDSPGFAYLRSYLVEAKDFTSVS